MYVIKLERFLQSNKETSFSLFSQYAIEALQNLV